MPVIVSSPPEKQKNDLICLSFFNTILVNFISYVHIIHLRKGYTVSFVTPWIDHSRIDVTEKIIQPGLRTDRKVSHLT